MWTFYMDFCVCLEFTPERRFKISHGWQFLFENLYSYSVVEYYYNLFNIHWENFIFPCRVWGQIVDIFHKMASAAGIGGRYSYYVRALSVSAASRLHRQSFEVWLSVKKVEFSFVKLESWKRWCLQLRLHLLGVVLLWEHHQSRGSHRQKRRQL